jgi:hypothetical protein
MRQLWTLVVVLALLPLYGQDFIVLHRDEEAHWAAKTGLSPLVVHRLRRSISHFADEQDDDSHIELLDTKALADRKQVLLVTSAGIPRCLTLTAFSNAAGFPKVWSADSTPEGRGFCDKLGIAVRFTIDMGGLEVVVPVDRHSPKASHADVEHWPYHWTGQTYSAGEKSLALEYLRQ